MKTYVYELRERIITVPCPACGAVKGSLCIGRKGQRTSTWHVDRTDAAKRAGKVAP